MVNPKYLVHYGLIFSLVNSSPIPDETLPHLNKTYGGDLVTRSIWSKSSPDAVIKKHWAGQAGALPGTQGHIAVGDKEMFLKDLNNNYVPLISLDCENADATDAYKGKYYGVCMNYLWWRYVLQPARYLTRDSKRETRNCDHTTKERSIKTNAPPGYVLLHRGEKGSNTVRRKLGGFKSRIPCSKSRANTNTFLLHDKETSQEEFPMALMEEGGRYTPSNGLIGTTRVASGVDRSPVFRCIDQKENSSQYKRSKKLFDVPYR